MTRARQDEEEFRGFVSAYSPTLLHAAYLLLRDRAAAEDAVQSTLLRTLRRWSQARNAPEAFSQRVLINVCRNHWRHQRRHPIHARTDDEPIPARPSVSEFDAVDQRLELEAALATLPDPQREVLVLRFFLDLSVTQTAQRLGIPEGTVKSMTHRALTALRQFLTEPQEVSDGR